MNVGFLSFQKACLRSDKKGHFLYAAFLIFIAAVPFLGNSCSIFRGISVSFCHYFQSNAPFDVEFRRLFTKYIQVSFIEIGIIALMIGAFLCKAVRAKEVFFNRYSIYLTSYVAIAFFSILFSLFSNYFFQYTTLINLSISFIGFHFIYVLFRKKPQWIIPTLFAFLIVAAIECFIGVGQFVMQRSLGLHFLSELKFNGLNLENISTYPIPEGSRDFFHSLPWISKEQAHLIRANGTFFSPNLFGPYLMTALLLSYYFFIKSIKKSTRIVLILLILFLVVTLSLTFSRAAFFASILGSGLFFLIGFVKRKALTQEQKKNFYFLGTLLIGVFLLTLAALFKHFAARGGIINYNHTSDLSDHFRMIYFKLGMSLFLSYPVLGIGYNGFALFPYEVLNPAFANLNPDGNLTHNLYLQIAAETGIMGISLMTLFVFSLYRGVFKQAFSLLTLVLGIIVFSLLVSGLADHVLWASASGRSLLLTLCALFAASFHKQNVFIK